MVPVHLQFSGQSLFSLHCPALREGDEMDEGEDEAKEGRGREGWGGRKK